MRYWMNIHGRRCETPGEEWGICVGNEGNCLPTVNIYGSIGKDEDENGNPIEVTVQMAEGLQKNYSEKLLFAIKEGDLAIKKFFLNDFAIKTDLPESLIQDFKKDRLTIKGIQNNYFIVEK